MAAALQYPSIVPLPFGSGYSDLRCVRTSSLAPSIVPLPFGSGYPPTCAVRVGSLRPSIVPLPFGSGYLYDAVYLRPTARPSIVPLPFGSGYKQPAIYATPSGIPSIVPLPFGSGYGYWPPMRWLRRRPLQLCRSLSGAVISGIRSPRTVLAPFNCAAPFRERLLRGVCGAGWPQRPFNCAAPFRERLSTSAQQLITHYLNPSIVPLPFGSGYH